MSCVIDSASTSRRARTSGSSTAEGRARLKNFFGTRLQKRILLDHDQRRSANEQKADLAASRRRPRRLLQDDDPALAEQEAMALEVSEEAGSLEAEERELQRLTVYVANMPVRR